MRIAVYGIAKDEAHNAAAFADSARSADAVVVLDTGSTDDTVAVLREHGATVYEDTISPWRFDEARNRALSLVPEDIDVCISIDLDEQLQAGWREALEKSWGNANFGSYMYVAAWNGDTPSIVAPRSKIHARHGYEWHRPVHEALRPSNGLAVQHVTVPDMWVHHHQTGSQRDYRELLSEILAQHPDDTEAWMQRASDQLSWGDYEAAIADYREYLRLTEGAEDVMTQHRRSLAWLDIAKASRRLERDPLPALIHATAECPQCREAWAYLAEYWASIGQWPNAYGAAMTAMQIEDRSIGATEEACWGDYPKQIASAAFCRIAGR